MEFRKENAKRRDSVGGRINKYTSYEMTSINTISRSVKYGLCFAASWPGMPWLILRRFIWIIVLSVCQSYQYRYVIIHYKYNTLIQVIDNLSICMPFTLTYIKLIVAWSNHTILHEMLRIMVEECQKYAVVDTEKIISKTAHLSYCLTSTVICVCVSSTAFYAVGVFVSQEPNVTTHRDLLLKMDLPFDTDSSPIYELVILLQYIYLASAAFTFGVFTGLLLMVVLHVGCQVDIMCRTLTEITCVNQKQLNFFVNRHQEIIIFTERIEKLFTYIALSQLISNTLLTCCLGYLIVIALRTDNGYIQLLKCVVFYVAICLEAFIYCFAGEYLSIKSKLIGDTAYEILWYNLRPSETRLLILVILRSQKGFTFTFGKFASLSMESFTDVMKASGSYMSVLLAMS